MQQYIYIAKLQCNFVLVKITNIRFSTYIKYISEQYVRRPEVYGGPLPAHPTTG